MAHQLRRRGRLITLSADKGYDSRDFVSIVRELNVAPHLSQAEAAVRWTGARLGGPL